MTTPNIPLPPPSTPTPASTASAHSPDHNEVEDMLAEEAVPYLDNESLTSTDIRTDPILFNLAKHQTRTISTTPTQKASPALFKARPAPSSVGGVGPRMTKSAALRLGLDWNELKPKREKEIDGKEVEAGFHNVPGHKRTGLNLNIASLALPTVAPRQTKSSQLRSGEQSSTPQPEKDRAAIAAANKARDLAERVQRRKSVALPASLSMPSIAPRTNRSSELRTAGPATPSTRPATASSSLRNGLPPSAFGRGNSALTSTSVTNLTERVTGEAEDKSGSSGTAKTLHNRRQSMHGPVKSLGTPSIVPRLNKAALLRAPGTAPSSALPSSPLASTSSHSTNPSHHAAPPRAVPASASTSAHLSKASPTPTPSVGPKPTKASLLRAGLGAKVLTR